MKINNDLFKNVTFAFIIEDKLFIIGDKYSVYQKFWSHNKKQPSKNYLIAFYFYSFVGNSGSNVFGITSSPSIIICSER